MSGILPVETVAHSDGSAVMQFSFGPAGIMVPNEDHTGLTFLLEEKGMPMNVFTIPLMAVRVHFDGGINPVLDSLSIDHPAWGKDR